MIRGAAMRARCGLGVAVGLATMLGVVAARAEVANRIVATVDGEPITAHELKQYAKDRDTGGAEGRQILDALITDKLLEREIKALGILARDDEIDRYIHEVQARTGMDDARFKQALAGQGMTWEQYRSKVKMEIEKAQLVNREIRQHGQRERTLPDPQRQSLRRHAGRAQGNLGVWLSKSASAELGGGSG